MKSISKATALLEHTAQQGTKKLLENSRESEYMPIVYFFRELILGASH